jgi:hypothetical protein
VTRFSAPTGTTALGRNELAEEFEELLLSFRLAVLSFGLDHGPIQVVHSDLFTWW